jgi:hypothetical protein
VISDRRIALFPCVYPIVTAGFALAAGVATITREQIRIVAGFVVLDLAIATSGRVVFRLAVRIAAVAVGEVAIVAFFLTRALAVAAVWPFELTACAAAIAVVAVAVVAGLAAVVLPVSADRQ